MRARVRTAVVSLSTLLLVSCAENAAVPTGPGVEGPALVVSSQAGKIVINEVMADPAAVADADGEWLELHNRGTSAVNLQGWSLAGNNDAPHTIASSVSIPAGGYVVLARSGSSATNGGVSAGYAYGAMNMANSADWIALRDGSGASVDSVVWATAMPAGYSRGVTDPDAANLDAKASYWHTAAVTYGSGDRGTPGAQNDGRRSPLTVRILEVGQGDGIYITNGASRIVVDGGPSMTSMAGFISEFGLAGKTINLMFMTHGHSDHLAGLREFFKSAHSIAIPYFFENKNTNSGTTIGYLRDSINARVGRGQTVYRDTDDPCGTGAAICTFLLDGGARLHVLRPKPSDANENNRSVALKLVGPDSASFTMWLSGDAEHDALEWFDATANYDVSPGMNVDVLKANHHGSCNGISSHFLDLTTPGYVTMGVSSSNTYSHVHTQTKTLLSSRSIPWYRTDENGRLTLTTPGTVGGGYTVSYTRGSASMSGASDAASVAAECASL
ncbi:MAG TPA: lamin tail domain-containing protein [Longimicrobium sp.]|nr:lamin tail domain-containing protein [Longimicrobium sp.]